MESEIRSESCLSKFFVLLPCPELCASALFCSFWDVSIFSDTSLGKAVRILCFPWASLTSSVVLPSGIFTHSISLSSRVSSPCSSRRPLQWYPGAEPPFPKRWPPDAVSKLSRALLVIAYLYRPYRKTYRFSLYLQLRSWCWYLLRKGELSPVTSRDTPFFSRSASLDVLCPEYFFLQSLQYFSVFDYDFDVGFRDVFLSHSLVFLLRTFVSF